MSNDNLPAENEAPSEREVDEYFIRRKRTWKKRLSDGAIVGLAIISPIYIDTQFFSNQFLSSAACIYIVIIAIFWILAYTFIIGVYEYEITALDKFKFNPYFWDLLKYIRMTEADIITEKEKAFLASASRGELENVLDYVADGGDINCRDPRSGRTALHFSVANQAHEITEFLLIQEALNPLIKDRAGRTASDYAYIIRDDIALGKRILKLEYAAQAKLGKDSPPELNSFL